MSKELYEVLEIKNLEKCSIELSLADDSIKHALGKVSPEVEYIAASEAAKEAVWIRNLLMDLGVVQGASIHWTYIVTTMVLSHKPRNLDNTRGTNIYSCGTPHSPVC